MKKICSFLVLIAFSISLSSQVPNYIPTQGLKAFYGLNGNTSDQSGNGNNLVAVNASLTTDRFGTSNSAYNLSTYDWVSASGFHQINSLYNVAYLETATAFHNPNSPHTISVWWKVKDTTLLYQTIFGSVPSRIEGLGFNTNLSSAAYLLSVCLGTGNGSTYDIFHETNNNINQVSIVKTFDKWHNSVFVKDNNVIRFYIDGNLATTLTFTQTVAPTSTKLRFGNNDNNAIQNASGQFDGKLDEIGIWDRALTACEIKQLYYGYYLTLNSNPICLGQTTTLNALGLNTYTWTPSTIISPTITTTYSVIGTHTLSGCILSSTIVQNVLALPNISVTSYPNILCLGESANLIVSGASTYTYNSVINPVVTTTYNIIGQGSNGCVNSVVYTQNVNPCTGIDEINKTQFNVYPNPSNGEFYITSNTDLKLNIVNELGQLIKEVYINEGKVFIEGIIPGIYFIVSQTTKKIIIVK